MEHKINAEIHVHLHGDSGNAAIMTGIREILDKLLILHQENGEQMSAITDLQNKFDAAKAKIVKAFADATTTLDDLKAKLDALVAQGGADPAELKALSDDISAASDDLSAKSDAIEATISTDDPATPASGSTGTGTDPTATPQARKL